MIHLLKTWPEFFNAIIEGRKTFEIRKDDRHFRVGDVLRLEEFDPTYHEGGPRGLTGREVLVGVTYITTWEQKPGNVVMGIEPLIKANCNSADH